METHQRTFLTRRGIAVRDVAPPSAGPGRPLAVGRNTDDRPPAGIELDLITGTMHYWRLDPTDWRPCLNAMRDLGVHIVDIPIPWVVHEPRPGACDWNGGRDLAGFLDRVGQAGMFAVIRPGPHLGGDLKGQGVPSHVLARDECLAVSARATPTWLPGAPRMTPLPSYAATGFQKRVATWFAAVGAIVGPRLAPDGPVIAAQVGHQAQYVDHLGAFDFDYHPQALAWWDAFSGGLEPPRAWESADVERCLLWMRFKDNYLAQTLRWLMQAVERAGMHGITQIHNLPWMEPARLDLPGAQAALGSNAIAGMSVGHRAGDYQTCRRRALYLAGSAVPLPYAAEVAVGAPAWSIPAPPDRDHQSCLLGLLAAGVRGFNLHMAVERVHWYGAPISEVGAMQASAQWLQTLMSVLDQVKWTALHRQIPVAIIAARVASHAAAASSTAGPLRPLLSAIAPPEVVDAPNLGRDVEAAAQHRWLGVVERALALAQVPYVLIDEACSIDHLARHRVLILPTIDRVGRATWLRLHALAKSGHVVIIGPGKPTRDECDQPLGADADLPSGAGLIRTGSDSDLDGLADDLLAVVDDLSDLWIAADQPDVDCSVFTDGGGTPRVIFAGNRGHEEISARITVPPSTILVDALTGEEFAVADDQVDVALDPQEIRMFVID